MEWWKRREVWLGALLVLLLAVVYKEVRAWLIPTLPPDLLVASAAGRQSGMTTDAVSDVFIDRLSAAGSSYDPRGRNLFQYGKPAAPPKPPAPPPDEDRERKLAEQKKQQARVAQIVADKRKADAEKKARQQNMQPRPRPAARPSAPKPPAAKYKFMGYMGRPARRIAVLLDDGEVVLKRKGENLGDDFVVREIRFDSVELGYTDERFKDEKALIPMGN